jgi:acyl-coenzyme A thioesterase PaaI-like protein
MTEEATASFLRPMGIVVTQGEGFSGGRALVSDELLIPGTPRIRSSILACWADVVAGSNANTISHGQVALTVDLTVRILAPPVAEAVVISSEVLKAGRNTIFCEARMTSERGVVFALSHMTFQSSPRPEDSLANMGLGGFITTIEAVAPSYPTPFFEFMGMRHPAPGTVELDRVPLVMNPAGTIQGGAVAAMVEAAAEDLSGPIGDLEMHYLKAVRVGPGRASAAALPVDGPRRVEVRDPGSDNRLCTLGVAWPAALA